MSDPVSLLFLLGSLLYLAMGLVHVALVLWDVPRGHLFLPADERLRKAMKDTTLTLSRQLSLMRTYRGLNLSHGLGVTVFGATATYLALHGFGELQPAVLLGIAAAFSLANLTVALRYWFGFPAMGYGAAAALFVAAGLVYWL